MEEALTLSRRDVLKVGAGTFAGYALVPDPAYAQAIKTDTQGIVAADASVKIGDYDMPVYEARPATGTGHPILLVISEIWGVHEYIRDSHAPLREGGLPRRRAGAVQARRRPRSA